MKDTYAYHDCNSDGLRKISDNTNEEVVALIYKEGDDLNSVEGRDPLFLPKDANELREYLTDLEEWIQGSVYEGGIVVLRKLKVKFV